MEKEHLLRQTFIALAKTSTYGLSCFVNATETREHQLLETRYSSSVSVYFPDLT